MKNSPDIIILKMEITDSTQFETKFSTWGVEGDFACRI